VTRRFGRSDIAIALAVLALHSIAIWGYTGLFWGDFGRWHHEVERFSAGEMPYRDFQWHYPPLSLWLIGFAARIAGTDIAPVFFITVSLAAVLVVLFTLYCRIAVDRADPWLVALCMLLALSYVQTVGPPLQAGAYSPAVLVGAICITIAALAFLHGWVAGTGPRGSGVLLGLCAGLAVLSKQDFWIPAAYLVAVDLVRHRRVAPGIVAALTVAAGVAIVVASAGSAILLPLVGGFNHARISGGMGFPSWERIVVDVFTGAVLMTGLFAVVSFARRRLLLVPLLACAGVAAMAGALHVGISMSTGSGDPGSIRTPSEIFLARHFEGGGSRLWPALGLLRLRVAAAPIPVVMAPILLAAVLSRWRSLDLNRRGLVATLLGFSILLRSRRAFEGTEWFEFLFVLPVCLAAVELLAAFDPAEFRRYRVAALAMLTLVVAHTYRVASQGPGTVRSYPGTVVDRGTVHWPPEDVRDFKQVRAALDSIDPDRTRPVFAFGFSGGWNYFLERTNPYPFTQNFRFSAFDADSVLALERPPGLFLIDNRFLENTTFTSLDIRFDRWEQERLPSPYPTFDRPRFERLRRGCTPLQVESSFPVYSCP
jgi:hypothetical protein